MIAAYEEAIDATDKMGAVIRKACESDLLAKSAAGDVLGELLKEVQDLRATLVRLEKNNVARFWAPTPGCKPRP